MVLWPTKRSNESTLGKLHLATPIHAWTPNRACTDEPSLFKNRPPALVKLRRRRVALLKLSNPWFGVGRLFVCNSNNSWENHSIFNRYLFSTQTRPILTTAHMWVRGPALAAPLQPKVGALPLASHQTKAARPTSLRRALFRPRIDLEKTPENESTSTNLREEGKRVDFQGKRSTNLVNPRRACTPSPPGTQVACGPSWLGPLLAEGQRTEGYDSTLLPICGLNGWFPRGALN